MATWIVPPSVPSTQPKLKVYEMRPKDPYGFAPPDVSVPFIICVFAVVDGAFGGDSRAGVTSPGML